MYDQILRYACFLAGDQYGCIALNEIITDLDDPYYRDQLLDIVANNALLLSNDAYGNFVVQHVLKLRDSRCTRNIADKLCGYCVELSFKKYGSYIVERLLEAGDVPMATVVLDLLACKTEMLIRLARSEYGNFVVCKALELTNEILTADLFYGLVNRLMPYRHLLHRSPRSKIATILDSMSVPN
ncbi:putative pumilio 17 [Arabidopsis thaliana]